MPLRQGAPFLIRICQVDGTSADRGQRESQDRAEGWDPK